MVSTRWGARLGGPIPLTVLMSFVSQAFLAVSGVIVARTLGVEDRGHFALLVLIPTILTQVGGLGLPTAVTYYLANPEYNSVEILRNVRRPAIALAAGLVPIQLLLILLLFQGDAPVAAAITLAATPGFFFFMYGAAFLQGLREFRLFNFLRVLPVSVYTASMLLLLLTDEGNLGAVASVWALGFVTTGLIVFLVGTRKVLLGGDGRNRVVSTRDLFSFGIKGLLGSTYPVDTFQLDQAVVGLFMSPPVLGLYVVAVAFTNLPRFVGQSVGMVAYPTVANAEDPLEARRRLNKLVMLTVGVSLIILTAIEVTASWIVPVLFGREFEGAVTLVRILLVASSLTAVRRVLTEGARGRGEPGVGSLAELVTWIVFVPAVAVLGAARQAEGVAWAMAVSSLAGLLAILIGTSGRNNDTPADENSLVTVGAPSESLEPADAPAPDLPSARPI
jgi:O-antigen/teichoic acid export membrane protein